MIPAEELLNLMLEVKNEIYKYCAIVAFVVGV